MTLPDLDRAERYLLRNPDPSPAELAGALSISPDRATELLDDLESDDEPPTPDEHYSLLEGLYAELGEIDGWHCIGNHDRHGWYHTRAGRGSWDGEGRAWALGKEFPGMRDELERVMYATINYAPADWYIHNWRPYTHGESGREWEDDSTPTPGYGDLRAYAPFADIDLADGVKKDRPGGDIPQEVIEEALGLYFDAFADLAGGIEHVYGLDSVGGAYAFVAPTATTPIADEFDRPDRALIFEDMTDRLNEWLDDVKDDVNEAVPDAAGVFEPDLLNNKNRLYKAPLSIHSSLDGVVTPVNVENPEYDYTPLEDVDDELVGDAEAWAAEFTGDHREAVSAVVATLWSDEYDSSDSWLDALRARVATLREAREQHQRDEEQTLSADELPDDLETTDDLDVLKATVEAIDVQDLARQVADEWDTAPGRDPPRFAASWHSSHGSGTSCFATRDKWVDLAEGGHGGGPLKMIARARGIITDSSQKLRGDDYWRAVNELRKAGCDIPYFTGHDGIHPDGLKLYDDPEDGDEAARQALRAVRASERK